MAKAAGKKRDLRSVTGNTGHVRNVGERSKTIGISSTQVAERFQAGKREKKIMIFFLGGGAFAFRLLKAERAFPSSLTSRNMTFEFHHKMSRPSTAWG